MKFKTIILLFLISSCSKFQTLGKVKHEFNERTDNIIWIQVAGFESEHIALVRLTRPNSIEPISFEKAMCVGNSWSYNLFDLRPDASASFMSQITGSKNIKNQCEDLDNAPLWKFLKEYDFKSVILESGASEKTSLTSYLGCKDYDDFFNDVSIIKMNASTEASKQFHFQENQQLVDGQVYFDKSCSKNNCHSSLYSNVKSLWENTLNKHKKKILIIRDFSYAKSLKKSDVESAQEILTDIERLYSYFMSQNMKNTLLLITSGEPLKLNFPKQGKDWLGYINKRNNMITRSSLNSNVFAYGAKSENFCGIYSESDIFERTLWLPEDNKLFKNLFNNQN